MATDDLIIIAVGCAVGAAVATAGLVCLVRWCLARRRKSRESLTYARIPTVVEPERRETRPAWSMLALPSPEKSLKTELVQPDATLPHSKINQQLGFQKDVSGGSLDSEEPEVSPRPVYLPTFRLENVDSEHPRPAGEDQGLGYLVYGIKYDFDCHNLEVRIVKACNLVPKDANGSSDPYVKIIITPGSKKYFLESKVRSKTLNPVWKETFYFEGFPLTKLANKSLVLQVLDFDRLSKDDPIGEVEIPFASVNFYAPGVFCSHLTPCKGNRRGLGELLVSLCYNSTAGKLTLLISKARNLKAKDLLGSSDPYVKVWLLYQGHRHEKRKTPVQMKTLSPVFDATFDFAVPLERVKDTSLHVYVMDYDKWSQNEVIGELLLSSKSGYTERKLWNEMLAKPKQFVGSWMVLRRMKDTKE